MPYTWLEGLEELSTYLGSLTTGFENLEEWA
jgi:hypothetical protein